MGGIYMIQNKPFVITISRMLGSGGAYIGQQLSNRLNALYLDREIVNEAAKEFDISEEELSIYDERPASFWESMFKASKVINESMYTAPKFFILDDRLVFNVERQIIERTVKENSAVIIGRGGSHILRDHPRHISVFLHADVDFRKSRVQNLYNLDEKDAIKRIAESDKRRSNFYKIFTGNEFSDSTQYTLCFDTSKVGLDECTHIILKYAKQKFGLLK